MDNDMYWSYQEGTGHANNKITIGVDKNDRILIRTDGMNDSGVPIFLPTHLALEAAEKLASIARAVEAREMGPGAWIAREVPEIT